MIRTTGGSEIEYSKIFNKFWAIIVGEEGRGRKIGYVPLSRELQMILDAGETPKPEDLTVIKTKKGGWLVIEQPGNSDLILCTNWYGGFRGHAESNVQELEKENKLEILATGNIADGIAGRMAKSRQYIIKIKEDADIYLARTGRTYGSGNAFLYKIRNNELEKIKLRRVYQRKGNIGDINVYGDSHERLRLIAQIEDDKDMFIATDANNPLL